MGRSPNGFATPRAAAARTEDVASADQAVPGAFGGSARRATVRAGGWLLAAALAGCALVPRLVAPEIRVDSVRVERLSVGEARFAVVLDVANPNDDTLVVEALDAELRIEGVVLGTARLEAPARLSARERTSTTLVVRAQLSSALRAAAAVAQRLESASGGRMAVRYAVTGVARLEGGRRIDFRRDGEMAWPGRGTGRGT